MYKAVVKTGLQEKAVIGGLSFFECNKVLWYEDMKDFTRSDLLFSLCGLNCGLCSMHLGGHCPGYGGGEGNQPCKIARCSKQHGEPEYCSLCRQFPCENYEKIDEYDSFISHLHQKRDLHKRDEIGTEAYRREQTEKRKMLEWLLLNYNDGRKKTFFSLAVNLMELQDIKEVKQQIGKDKEIEDLTIKEKAARVKRLLEDKARERQVTLQLKKKK